MEYNFIEELIDKKSISKSESGISSFLLENNINQIEKIFDFFNSKKKLLLISGFLGTGKNQIITHALSFKTPETIVLKYTCFETTVLDDILLSFFDNFRKMAAQGIIDTPKTKSDNFIQKISAYFQSVEKPVVIVLDSFQDILKDSKQEVLDFLFHLSALSKVKIVLISRVFSLEEFEGKVEYDKISILALDKSIFEKYLRSEGIKQIGPLSDELYKYTRGYYFYTALSIKIIQLRKLALTEFMTGYNKSFLSYNDFILREALNLVDPVSGHLFRFLTVIRHPVNINLLKTLQLYNEEKINFFIENMVLSKEHSNIFLPDYYKDISENSIPENIAAKLHKGCVDLYETQLPLKPLERDLMISRQTMRKEIEYHSLFIPKKPVLKRPALESQEVDISAVIQQSEPENQKQEKDNMIKNMTFIFDSEESDDILNSIANSIKNYIEIFDKNAQDEEEIKRLSLVDLINLAKKEEQQFNFKKVVTIYQRALTFNNDDDFYTFLPTLLTKLAHAYQSLSDWFNSLKYYEMAQEFYNSTGDTEKINEIKWEIANIYFITFKRDKAKSLLSDILNSENISNSLKVKTYLLLANITDNTSEQIIFDYYKRALESVDNSIDKQILSELYFKFALILDEKNEPEQAIKYYKKCTDIDANPKVNSYLSSAYSNIATIFDEAGKTELATKYSLESLRVDELTKNYNGIYISAMKLAELYLRKDTEKSIEYYKKAKSCAIELNEPFYIASSDIALGDFYANRKNDEQAFKYYQEALKTAENNFSKDNISKIEMRINDIKLRIGEIEFNKIISG